jgi:hypothetical protein
VASSTTAQQQISVQPPGGPWRELKVGDGPHGYMSIYLSDSLSRYPIRAVTRPRDNKSDPNIETGTYGVFSTCQERMRRSIVTRGVPYIFFVTTHGHAGRALTGYYRIRWYAPGPEKDWVLAADPWRFVNPIPTTKASPSLRRALEIRRGYTGLDEAQAEEALKLVDAQPSRNDQYLAEITRLETLSLRRTGYRYPTWAREAEFGWDAAGEWLRQPDAGISEKVPNKSPSGIWVCQSCTESFVSEARHKRCPSCGRLSTLRPLTKES